MVTSENLQKLTFFRNFWLIFGGNFTFIWPGHGCSSCMPNSKFCPSSHGSHPMPNTVLFRSIRPSRVTRQVDMAEIHRLSQVTEVVAGVEKPLVKKAKIHFFFEP